MANRNINEYLSSGEVEEIKQLKVTLLDNGKEVSLDWDSDKDIANFQTTLKLALNSLKLDETYTISASLNNVSFIKDFSDEVLHPVWEGEKDQSVPANQDASGVMKAFTPVLDDNMISFEAFGVPSAVVVNYQYSVISASADARVYGISFKTAQALTAGDFVTYKVYTDFGTPDQVLVYLQELELGASYVDGDVVTVWFTQGMDQRVGDNLEVQLMDGRVESTTLMSVYQADVILNPYTAFQTRLMTIENVATEAYVDAPKDYRDYNNDIANPTYEEGRVFYDRDKKTLSYYNDEIDTTINLAQELIIKVHNNNGATIQNGMAVRADGGIVSGVPTVVRSQADTVDNAGVAGVATHDILVGSTGYITVWGSIGGLDTSSWTAGDLLFLSATTLGELTNVEQQILKPVALVLESHATEGVILASQKPIVNVLAIGQAAKDTGNPTQSVNTTPEPVSAYGNTALPLENVTANFTASEGNYECEFVPASIGASGFYEVKFNATVSYGDSKDIIFTLYVDGDPTSLTAEIPFDSIGSSESFPVSFSGITPEVIDNTEGLEIYVESAESSGTLTFISCTFSVTRIGNV